MSIFRQPERMSTFDVCFLSDSRIVIELLQRANYASQMLVMECFLDYWVWTDESLVHNYSSRRILLILLRIVKSMQCDQHDWIPAITVSSGTSNQSAICHDNISARIIQERACNPVAPFHSKLQSHDQYANMPACTLHKAHTHFQPVIIMSKW